MLKVRLTRKYADVIDGVNLSEAHVGDQLELPQHDAEVLIAEGWAERSTQRRIVRDSHLAHAADRSSSSRSPRAPSRGEKPRRKRRSGQ